MSVGRDRYRRVTRAIRALLWERELVPDPHGVVSLALVLGVLFSHLTLVPRDGFLWSDSLLVEILGHAWFLAAPPLSLFLGLRHLSRRADSLLPFLSVPLAFLLTLTTGLGLTLAFLGSWL